MDRCNLISALHPEVRQHFANLTNELAKVIDGHRFVPFETFRTPMRQDFLLTQPESPTHAAAWKSAHQYGCAVDFVAEWPDDVHHSMWGADARWSRVRDTATRCGLQLPVKGDLGHVEHQEFFLSMLRAGKLA